MTEYLDELPNDTDCPTRHHFKGKFSCQLTDEFGPPTDFGKRSGGDQGYAKSAVGLYFVEREEP